MNTPPDITDDILRAVPPRRAKHVPPQRPAQDQAAGLTADPTAETMADAMAGGAGDVRAGTRPGWVWALPGGPGCAGYARRALGGALASLDVPGEVIGDSQLMVSELATNAHQHAGDHGPHELWLYRGDGATGEVRCAVFDAFADAALPGYSWTSGDCGRGLSIVRELSEGRWGMVRTLSRLGPPVRGKAVWFAVPAHGRVELPLPCP
ncbi:ATP-binding protein [Actinomadura rubrisoli]|uniref:ATP-binding protein n=1 Tax=Actinomadura rubrisoli TaxID=2530368 RepID=A0A4R5AFZ1_9ACTN|nr:ATP-binding protein [Actinomadura rubrisoli]TDD70159.1 ATP-binding protein [Actinomadura rubrisoli]